MLTATLHRLWFGRLHLSSRKALPLVVFLNIALTGIVSAAERQYPVALMNWMVEGTFHALIVDKSQQRLTVWEIREGEPSMIESYRCSTGENEGDKWVRGDMRTPEGVYFFCSVIDGRSLPPKYGLWAFTTNYPNFVDRRHGKSGDGIWLHGRDKPLGPKPDSNGCIALENQDLIKVSRFIKLQHTPLIVVKKLKLAPRSAVVEQERELRDFIENWRQSWESQDLDSYMGHYSLNFQSCRLDYKAWKDKKRKLNERYRKIRVRLSNVNLYRQNGLVTAIFSQDYNSDSYRSSGVKVLYLVNDGTYRIYAEDYHRPVDDPFPVGSLLAGINQFPSDRYRPRQDLGIRLVSTDEPENGVEAELESPRPSAPSRGVVLKTIAAVADVAAPALESNEKFVHETSPDRLIVARIVPAYSPSQDLNSPFGLADKQVKAREPLESDVGDTGVVPGPAAVAAAGKPREYEDSGRASSRLQTRSEKLPRAETRDTKDDESPDETHRAEVRDSVAKFLAQWKRAWEQKDLDGYLSMYHPEFGGDAFDFKKLAQTRKRYFRKYGMIRVKMERLQIRKVEKQLHVKFLQIFRGDEYSDKGWKSMVLVRGKDKGLRILSEEWSAL
ncbi:MAG: L,D-transpeptidase family protein [Desulfomonilaceae bacterium]|nr:L,D-transpeptidase family protein [Desulfomonilaceae bacterium]